jgi:hypothetical protein
MTTYASLTPAQQAQAAYLFADELMGSDPTLYEYELIGETVVGRAAISDQRSAVNARKPHIVAVNVAVREVPDAFITVEMMRRSDVTFQSLARRVVERIIQNQSVEAR